MSILEKIQTLKDQIRGDIEINKEVLIDHSLDSSIFQMMPTCVIYPKDINDIVIIVNFISDIKLNNPNIKNTSISVRAGGTCMSGGSLGEGIIINMTKYMNSVEIDFDNKTATVDMGVYLRDLNNKLETNVINNNLIFAPYPSSKDLCGIGGMIGNNASGEKSLRYGATIDNIINLEIVMANGTIINTKDINFNNQNTIYFKKVLEICNKYRDLFLQKAGNVRKIASGYRIDKVKPHNMTSLFVGSQGTLGIVTRATIKLVDKNKFECLTVISVQNINDLPIILQYAKDNDAEAVEVFDINTYNIAKSILITDTENINTYVTDKTEAIILVEFAEITQDQTKNKAQEYVKLLADKNINSFLIEDVLQKDSFWNIRRHAFSLIRDNHDQDFRPVPCIEDIIVPLYNFDKFVHGLKSILEEENLKYVYHGHIGDGSLRVIPLFKNDIYIVENIVKLMSKVFVLLKDVEGNMSADHSDGIIRSPFVRGFYGEDVYNAFVEIKNILDPYNIMNPGKKVNGSIDNIKRYLKRSVY